MAPACAAPEEVAHDGGEQRRDRAVGVAEGERGRRTATRRPCDARECDEGHGLHRHRRARRSACGPMRSDTGPIDEAPATAPAPRTLDHGRRAQRRVPEVARERHQVHERDEHGHPRRGERAPSNQRRRREQRRRRASARRRRGPAGGGDVAIGVEAHGLGVAAHARAPPRPGRRARGAENDVGGRASPGRPRRAARAGGARTCPTLPPLDASPTAQAAPAREPLHDRRCCTARRPCPCRAPPPRRTGRRAARARSPGHGRQRARRGTRRRRAMTRAGPSGRSAGRRGSRTPSSRRRRARRRRPGWPGSSRTRRAARRRRHRRSTARRRR